MIDSEHYLTVNAECRREDFRLSVNLDIELSGATAFFGKSGAGKSSLLRLIAGLDKEASVSVSFGDEVWQSPSVAKSRVQRGNKGIWVPPHRRRIGYVFQSPSLFEHLSVAGNLSCLLYTSPSPRDA